MSRQQQTDRTPIAQAINGFDQLAARQVSIDNWRVLSWRNGSMTAHKVNTRGLTCTCDDQAYNKPGAEVCDHLAVALYQSKQQLDVAEALREQMYDEMRDLDRAVSAIQQKATAVRASDQAGDYDDSSQADSDDESGSIGDPVEQTKSLLRDAGWSPEDFDVYLDDDLGSVQIETESLSQKDFADWQDYAVETDWLNYDSDNYRNYIKEEDFREVFN
jgi:hypothetical protein